MKIVALAVLFIAASLLLAGCSGQAAQNTSPQGGNPPAGGNNAPVQNNAQPHSGQNAQQESGSAPAQGNPPQTSANDPFESLINLFKMKNGNGWTVTYSVHSSTPSYSSDSTMAMYFKNQETIRTDASASGMVIRSFINGSDVFVCYQVNAKWSCMKAAEYNQSTSDEVEKDIESGKSAYKVEPLPPRTIAGALAQCYKLSDANTTVTYCFSPEGVPLLTDTSTSYGGTVANYTVMATSYKTSVSDSDFILPASPSATPDYSAIAGAYGGSTEGAGGSGNSGSVPADTCQYCSYLSGSQKDECLSSCSSG